MTLAHPFAPPDVADQPFRPVLDTVLDVPVPPSVNRTRSVNWAGVGAVKKWQERAGMMLIASGQYRRAQKGIVRFQVTVTLCETLCRTDADNILKHAIDYLRHLGIITNDAPTNMRRIVVEWGLAPAGCRIVVQPLPSGAPA